MLGTTSGIMMFTYVQVEMQRLDVLGPSHDVDPGAEIARCERRT